MSIWGWKILARQHPTKTSRCTPEWPSASVARLRVRSRLALLKSAQMQNRPRPRQRPCRGGTWRRGNQARAAFRPTSIIHPHALLAELLDRMAMLLVGIEPPPSLVQLVHQRASIPRQCGLATDAVQGHRESRCCSWSISNRTPSIAARLVKVGRIAIERSQHYGTDRITFDRGRILRSALFATTRSPILAQRPRPAGPVEVTPSVSAGWYLRQIHRAQRHSLTGDSRLSRAHRKHQRAVANTRMPRPRLIDHDMRDPGDE